MAVEHIARRLAKARRKAGQYGLLVDVLWVAHQQGHPVPDLARDLRRQSVTLTALHAATAALVLSGLLSGGSPWIGSVQAALRAEYKEA